VSHLQEQSLVQGCSHSKVIGSCDSVLGISTHCIDQQGVVEGLSELIDSVWHGTDFGAHQKLGEETMRRSAGNKE
jgi:hypothetical protein